MAGKGPAVARPLIRRWRVLAAVLQSWELTQVRGVVDELMYAARMQGKNRLEKLVVGQ